MAAGPRAEGEPSTPEPHCIDVGGGTVLSQWRVFVPSLHLDCGAVLRHVPCAYSTFGAVSSTRDNCIVVGAGAGAFDDGPASSSPGRRVTAQVCHALTGHSVVTDWWAGLVGSGRTLDTDRCVVRAGSTRPAAHGRIAGRTGTTSSASMSSRRRTDPRAR